MNSSVQFDSAFLGAGWRCLARWVTSTRKRVLSFALLLLLAACNAPPMYNTRAQEYLQKQGVSNDLILRLVEGRRLSENEAVMLEQFGKATFLHPFPGKPVTAVLHLLASNPSIPAPMIARLAASHDEEVRWGVAYNPSAPIEILLLLRTPSKYATINEYLARNPRIPTKVLLEMYRNKEANRVGFAMNPSCPADLMREIAEQGTDLDRTWLAANPSLPVDLVVRLASDPSEHVQRFLARNRAFKDWKASAGDKDKRERQ